MPSARFVDPDTVQVDHAAGCTYRSDVEVATLDVRRSTDPSGSASAQRVGDRRLVERDVGLGDAGRRDQPGVAGLQQGHEEPDRLVALAGAAVRGVRLEHHRVAGPQLLSGAPDAQRLEP